MNRYLLLSYANAFISYLMRSTNIDLDSIKTVYVFGSVARGDFDKTSDIDIFIDTENKKVETNIKKVLSKFIASDEIKKFELLGIRNEIKVTVGDIEEWELKESIIDDGIILYSSTLPSKKPYFIVTVDTIQDITKRNRVFRKLFGRREKHYKNKGTLSEINAETIDNKTFIAPAEKINKPLKILSKENVKYKIIKVWK